MRFIKKTVVTLSALTTLCCLSANAQSNVMPVYTPGGTIPNFSIYDLLSPLPQLKQMGWWYFVGLLTGENKQEHSLQVTLDRLNVGNAIFGLGSIGFTFKDSLGKTVYLWNEYPTFSMLKYLPLAPLQNLPAISNDFHVGIQSNPGDQNAFLYNFAHSIDDTQHWVGQIGAQYTVNAHGIGEIGAAENNPQMVSYDVQLTLQDQRGVVPEGYNGYVGSMAFGPSTDQNSWEYAAPNLRILQWQITVKPIGTVTSASLLTKPMTFQNKNSHQRIWMDRQILHKQGVVDSSQPISALQALAAAKTNGGFSATTSKPMYFGTWMSFCFNHTGLKNTCGDAVAIWQPNTPTNMMDSDTTASAGFINLFTPDSNGAGFPQQVGSTQTEALSIKGNQKDLPFDIKNDPNSTFTSPLSHRTYAKVVYVRIRKNTSFSALLHQKLNSITDNTALELKFVMLSTQTENVPGDNTAGYYEGAAHVFLCGNTGETCKPIGTGFIEQMGYN